MERRTKLKLFLTLFVTAFFISIVIIAILYSGILHRERKDVQDYVGPENPMIGLTFEQAVEQFDETFVSYILYSLEAYNLHPPLLSSDKPSIEFYIEI